MDKDKCREYRLKHPGQATEASRKWKLKNKERNKEINKIWKQNHPEKVKASNGKTYLGYCIPQEYELIENYELAKADNFKEWHCHHRLELHPDFSIRYTVNSLKKLGLYFNRPARELIFLTNSEHARRHAIGKWNE